MANLVFKYSWDHRPFPYNSAQGKRQFMLPFASGIPNINPDFSQVQGTAGVSQGGTGATDAQNARKNLGAAASGDNSDITGLNGLTKAIAVSQGGTGATDAQTARANLGLTLTSTSMDNSTGRITKVGDFGLGGVLVSPTLAESIDLNKFTHFFSTSSAVPLASQYAHGLRVARSDIGYADLLLPYSTGARPNRVAVRSVYSGVAVEQIIYSSKDPIVFSTNKSEVSGRIVVVESTGELCSKGFTVDANGFYKNASPIIQLFANKIELNDEAREQDITFERLGVGSYLILGTSGFAQEGWYIEQPRDANGNLFHVVEYKTLENGDIEIKTYDYMLDRKGRIVADYSTPLDIQEGRWIDIRLQELPKPEIEDDSEIVLHEITPPEFQPTNLSEAVAAAMVGIAPPELSEETK
ncbi:phage tail protein [Acinetobacter baumannii]|uniref:phage tail fiber protein n=1 Tax=Acinetobacter baumannii TaxID=470 RepID=UPI002448C231|nr:phage tail protein [Acinetobacter baumannii]MDH2530045.1 phage tail protein [Acinetobacter baumannii]